MAKNKIKMSYGERAALAQNPVAQKLFLLMEKKRTNLAVADDVTDACEFLSIASELGQEIAVLKTHIDILQDFSPRVIDELLALAKKHNFLIFEDRKLADIGNTVKLQYSKGIYKIVEWADLVNVHIVPGPGVIEGIKEAIVNSGKARGILILAQMSSDGTLAKGDYTKSAILMANSYKDVVAGYIGAGSEPDELRRLSEIADPGHAIFAPGVKIGAAADALKQKYATPEKAIAAGADLIVVGRGIYDAEDKIAAAKKYREAAWAAYEERIS